MPQTNRDRSLVEHLATVVCKWKWVQVSGRPKDSLPEGAEHILRYSFNAWNPLDSWADAGMVWERAREMGIYISMIGFIDGWEATDDGRLFELKPIDVICQSLPRGGPRAICEAIGKATGWQEPQ